jgi:hypothetical protein
MHVKIVAASLEQRPQFLITSYSIHTSMSVPSIDTELYIENIVIQVTSQALSSTHNN